MYWKARFSHCIYQKNDVYVFQNWLFRWLAFESMTIQTLIHRRHPERIELNYIEALTLPLIQRPGKTCVLGLGGAGVLHALAPFYQNVSCVAVESNPTVIEVAQSHFFLERLAFVKIQQQDAYTFLAKSTETFNYLLVDLFNATHFPTHCNTSDFIALCKKNLSHNGILGINFANFRNQASLLPYLKLHFTQMVFVSLPRTTNLVVLCTQAENFQRLLELLQSNSRVQSVTWQPQWGYVAYL